MGPLIGQRQAADELPGGRFIVGQVPSAEYIEMTILAVRTLWQGWRSDDGKGAHGY